MSKALWPALLSFWILAFSPVGLADETVPFSLADLAKDCKFDPVDIQDFPIISEKVSLKKENVHPDAISGRLNDGIYQGTYQGEPVVVKKYRVDLKITKCSSLETETRAFLKLGAEKLTPQFYGLVSFGANEYGIVTKKVFPSILLRDINALGGFNSIAELDLELDRFKAAPTQLRKKWLKSIQFAFRRLLDLRAEILDIHFLLDDDGNAYLIDLADAYFSLPGLNFLATTFSRWNDALTELADSEAESL